MGLSGWQLTLFALDHLEVFEVGREQLICTLLQVHGEKLSDLLLEHERRYAGSAQNVKTPCYLSQCFELFAVALASELFQLLRLQICLHCEVVARLRVVKD